MPIKINNSHPSINFRFGGKKDDDNRMMMMVDTSTAIKTGNLNYHLWVMSQCQEIVAKYLQCEEDTEYEVVQLLAILDLNMEFKPSTPGHMTAVMLYHTSFYVNKKDPLIL